MSTFNLSSVFTVEVLAGKFESKTIEQAARGSFYPPALSLYNDVFGLKIPCGDKTQNVTIFKYLNSLFTSEKPLKLLKGKGSKVGTVAAIQSLHAYATAVLGDRKTSIIEPLAAWACPVAIAAKEAEAKAKRESKKANAADGLGDGETVPEANKAEGLAAEKSKAIDVVSVYNSMVAIAKQGLLTTSQRDELLALLETATTVSEAPTTKRKKAQVA